MNSTMNFRASMGDPGSSSTANKVNVAIRVRPFIEREHEEAAPRHWIVGPNELRQLPAENEKPSGLVYHYDNVFGESTQTAEVYTKVVAPIVNESFKGFNGTILCYGQTSSGKTHTLYGTDSEKGIIALFADHLFDRIKDDEGKRQYIIKVGLLEIYNEMLIDLWNSDKSITLMEKDGKVLPNGLKETTIVDPDDLNELANRIQRQRHIGETRMNKESSRSHTILRVMIESFDLAGENVVIEDIPGDGVVANDSRMTSAVLNFVDLAGSEKQSQTGAEGEKFRQAVHINKSLSSLSRVIAQLSDYAAAPPASKNQVTDALCTDKRAGPQSRFVNFRDSKLTRLLKSTLNGEAYTSMICCVTPACLDETKSTLNFAKLAKKIEIAPKQNLSSKTEYEKKLTELQQIIEGKDKEMLALKRQVQNLQLSRGGFTKTTHALPNIMNDRRHSLCPGLLHRSSESNLPSTDFGFNHLRFASSEETFLSTEETMRHFQKLTSIKESAISEEPRCDKEIQTEPEAFLSPKKRLEFNGAPPTPVQTLRMTTSLLRETCESDRSDWMDEKNFLESENVSLKEEAEKVLILQKEVQKLKNEKQELENDVFMQIQRSQSQLKRQQAEFDEQLAAMQLHGPEKISVDTQCHLTADEKIELQKYFEADRARWLDEKNLLESENGALKEEADKVIILQKEVQKLKDEKQDLENAISLQIQRSQSQLERQRAEFDEKITKVQAVKIENKTVDVQCDLVVDNEVKLRQCFEAERTELIDEKNLLESENAALKEEADKVIILQKEVQKLKDEKQDLENAISLQIQRSQSQLERQQAEFDEKITKVQAVKIENKTVDVQCDLVVDNEVKLRQCFEAERTELIDEKNLLESENAALKEEADKVIILQKEVQKLKNEKQELENDVFMQIQRSQSQLERQQAEFDEKITKVQAVKIENKTVDVQCDLVVDNEVKLRQCFEAERERWLDEKKLIESENSELMEKATRVLSENQTLMQEREELGKAVEEQIQSYESELRRQQAEIVEKVAELQSLKTEKNTVDVHVQCGLATNTELELRKSLQTEQMDWQREKKLIESENSVLTGKVARYYLLEGENEKLRAETEELKRQKAEQEKKVAAGKSLRNPKNTIEVQCDLATNTELELRKSLQTEQMDWQREKKLIESENSVLTEKAARYYLLEGENHKLKAETEELKRQKSELDDKLSSSRSTSIMRTTRPIQCELLVDTNENYYRGKFRDFQMQLAALNKQLLVAKDQSRERKMKNAELERKVAHLEAMNKKTEVTLPIKKQEKIPIPSENPEQKTEERPSWAWLDDLLESK